MTQRRDAAIARPAARQNGLATRAQLREGGLTARQIDWAAQQDPLERMHRGVYRHQAAPFTVLTRLHGAVLAAGPLAVASRRSAAFLHDFDGIRVGVPEVLVPSSGVPRLGGVRVHRTKHLPPADRTIVNGIPATSPARTALELGAVLPFEVVEQVVQTAVIAKKLDVHEIFAVLDRSGRRGRNGTAALRTIARQALPPEQVESVLELRLLALVRQAGLPTPTLQFEVSAGARCVRLDIAWPEIHAAVEGDGHRWHATSQKVALDRARRRSIRAAGWHLDVYGWDDVVTHPDRVVAELRGLLPRFASQ
jgi:hypothetical protein